MRANLSGAYLREANLSEANLSGAYLREANLSEANLSEANLLEADLSRADLSKVLFSETNLSKANLERAYLYQTEFLDVKQLKSAKDWEKAVYTEADWDFSTFKWIPKDKAANEAKIEEIRNLDDGILEF